MDFVKLIYTKFVNEIHAAKKMEWFYIMEGDAFSPSRHGCISGS
jgi:hypothetical protein